MNYVIELITVAKKFSKTVSLERDDKSHKFRVTISAVVYKDKNSPLHLPAFGSGFTIEDACYHYIMKAKNGLLINVITNEEVEV